MNNLLILRAKFWFSELKKFSKFFNFSSCKILEIYLFSIWEILKMSNLENFKNFPKRKIFIIDKFIKKIKNLN